MSAWMRNLCCNRSGPFALAREAVHVAHSSVFYHGHDIVVTLGRRVSGERIEIEIV